MEKEIYGYVLEEQWKFYSNGRDKEPTLSYWHRSFRKKCYQDKKSALDAIMQMKRGQAKDSNPTSYKLISVYLGEEEII